MKPTNMLHSVNYVIIQKISEKERSIRGLARLIEFLVPPLEFLVATLAGILTHLLCLGLFAFCLPKLFGGSSKGVRLQIKILSFCFLLFFFFINQFYQGDLSTDQITVDVSELLHSEEQLLRTDKEPCFLDRQAFLSMIK